MTTSRQLSLVPQRGNCADSLTAAHSRFRPASTNPGELIWIIYMRVVQA
jgi:hypothetical protein